MNNCLEHYVALQVQSVCIPESMVKNWYLSQGVNCPDLRKQTNEYVSAHKKASSLRKFRKIEIVFLGIFFVLIAVSLLSIFFFDWFPIEFSLLPLILGIVTYFIDQLVSYQLQKLDDVYSHNWSYLCNDLEEVMKLMTGSKISSRFLSREPVGIYTEDFSKEIESRLLGLARVIVEAQKNGNSYFLDKTDFSHLHALTRSFGLVTKGKHEYYEEVEEKV